MKKPFSLIAAMLVIGLLALPAVSLSHEGEHRDSGHNQSKKHSKRFEEGSGTSAVGSGYEGREYSEHNKQKAGSLPPEGSDGMRTGHTESKSQEMKDSHTRDKGRSQGRMREGS